MFEIPPNVASSILLRYLQVGGVSNMRRLQFSDLPFHVVLRASWS